MTVSDKTPEEGSSMEIRASVMPLGKTGGSGCVTRAIMGFMGKRRSLLSQGSASRGEV